MPKPGTTDQAYRPSKNNPSGRMLAYAKDGKIQEIFVADAGHEKQLNESYGTEILPVSIGRADSKGCFFIPLWGFNEGITEAALFTENGEHLFDLPVAKYR
jgi:hypothetical protein